MSRRLLATFTDRNNWVSSQIKRCFICLLVALKTLVGKVVYEYKLDETTLLAYTNNQDPYQSWPPVYARIQREEQGVRAPPPLKNHKNIRSLGSPEKSQGYQASIQCWATISTPAKRHLNGVSLAGQ